MTHRILSPFKSIALFAAFRLGARRVETLEQVSPQPRRRTLELNEVPASSASDEWLFDAEMPVHEGASLYTREMGRASGSLSQLRSLLTQISAHAPMVDARSDVAPFGPMAGDPLLFEGEEMAASFENFPMDDVEMFEDGFIADARHEAEQLRNVA